MFQCGHSVTPGKDCPSCRSRHHQQKLKREVIDAYGGKCACCGIREITFLSIDHVNGGGTKHIKSLVKPFYRFLRDSGYPQDGTYRVLCMNCQFGYAFMGICPHKLP